MPFILARPSRIAIAALATAVPILASAYDGIYFFGDSLTDVGNVTATYATLPHPLGAPAVIPGAPYDVEGRASNGPVYADVLAAGLGFAATPSALGGNDFAVGGARTRYQIFGPPFAGIDEQVAQFRARPGPADPGALYVLWAGSNNLQDLFLRKATDVNGAPIPDVSATLRDVRGELDALVAEGARNLLVPNVANLARVPRVSEFGPGAAAAAEGLVRTYNDGMATMLDAFEADHPDVALVRFDTFATFERIVGAVEAAGWNVTDRCYTGDDLSFTGGGSVCADPSRYVFWDGIHPTRAAHALLGQAMLAAVPEPSSGTLLGLGLVLAAFAATLRGRSGSTGTASGVAAPVMRTAAPAVAEATQTAGTPGTAEAS